MKVETSFASQLYESARRIAAPEADMPGDAGPARERSFADAIASAVSGMAAEVSGGEQAARAAMAGQGDVQSVVEALTATELALQSAVAIRDRVVEAYQEVLRMPV